MFCPIYFAPHFSDILDQRLYLLSFVSSPQVLGASDESHLQRVASELCVLPVHRNFGAIF
jgi:hypothetical protein